MINFWTIVGITLLAGIVWMLIPKDSEECSGSCEGNMDNPCPPIIPNQSDLLKNTPNASDTRGVEKLMEEHFKKYPSQMNSGEGLG